jgi:hypothetical protein
MHEDSPVPFITIRTPTPRDLYERALDLAGQIHNVLERAATRFHLKDRLDRASTGLVFELARARREIRSRSWRNYRRAQELATDIATILDLFEHQGVIVAHDLRPLRTLLHEVLEDLLPLTQG